MKVKELIKLLEDIDGDMDIVVWNSHSQFTGMRYVTVNKVYSNAFMFDGVDDCFIGWPAECDKEYIESICDKEFDEVEYKKVVSIS